MRIGVAWQRDKSGQAGELICIVVYVSTGLRAAAEAHLCKTFDASVVSELFGECVSAIEAASAGGTEQLHGIGPWNLIAALRLVLNCRAQPGCEARIRSLAPALEFFLQHDLVLSPELGATSASYVAQIGEPASATPQHVAPADH